MKIYTKNGDCGQTSLIGGKRVSKANLRLESYGALDELNAHLALLREYIPSESGKAHILDIQRHLFRIGSQLATDPGCRNPKVKANYEKVSEISLSEIQDLETEIDLIELALPEHNQFILPGGDKASAQCHICRTVCRRAERCCVALFEQEPGDTHILAYLNRLSDYLFVLSRKLCLNETEELFWDGL